MFDWAPWAIAVSDANKDLVWMWKARGGRL